MSSVKNKEGQGIISSASGTDEDYDKVVERLRKRYDQARSTYKMHLQKLIQSCVRYTREDIYKSMDLWNDHLQGLRQYGPFELSNALTAIAEMSMDEETFKEWSIFSSEEETTPTHDLFLKFLEQRANALPANSKSSPPVKRVTKFAAFYTRYQAVCTVRGAANHALYQYSNFRDSQWISASPLFRDSRHVSTVWDWITMPGPVPA